MNLTGREKATIFLSILGSDTASRILRYLPEELADVIATSISHLPTPTPEALGAVLNEFKGELELEAHEETPALEAPEQAPEPSTEEAHSDTPLGKLNATPAKKLAYLFSFERPQLVAFIISRLDPSNREEILNNMGPHKDEVLSLLDNIKVNKFTTKIEQELLLMFSEKV